MHDFDALFGIDAIKEGSPMNSRSSSTASGSTTGANVITLALSVCWP
jgi:hypothetical protein